MNALAKLVIYDHRIVGATLHARRTLEMLYGKKRAREMADPRRGRFFMLLGTSATPFYGSMDKESCVLEWVRELFKRNDCARLQLQYCQLAPELAGAISRLYLQAAEKMTP
jgi:hypothetical protein